MLASAWAPASPGGDEPAGHEDRRAAVALRERAGEVVGAGLGYPNARMYVSADV
ncbi:hypothetical protein [Arthrobacter sp. H14-L1]|uniref:hypothetical protein n=1 Tax=Arthrobacter sp. H14-L1 TaxID=2996697 RepID=UPI002D1E3C04|nr:hypothetical protein [Arthrobacter sp. H14-L1]